ncbi:MAG TPA: hypothetical protein VFK20_09125 [Vicinamibacterales bacterium]|nr:hypothetical protein [Vicinamibacterales bacterium]
MTNRFLERRVRAVELEPFEVGSIRLPRLAAQFIPDAIDNGLTQIGLERTRASVLEAVDPLKRLKQGVLDEIVRVGQVARPSGQPTAGPSPKRLEMTGEQLVQRRLIARTRAIDQLDRGFGAACPLREVLRRTGVLRHRSLRPRTGWRMLTESGPDRVGKAFRKVSEWEEL